MEVQNWSEAQDPRGKVKKKEKKKKDENELRA